MNQQIQIHQDEEGQEIQITSNDENRSTSAHRKKSIRKIIKIIASYCIIFGLNLFLLIDSIHNNIFYNILKQTFLIKDDNDISNFYSILIVIGISCVLTVCRLPGIIFHPIIGYVFAISLESMIIGILLSTLILFCGISVGSIVSYSLARYIIQPLVMRRKNNSSSLSSKVRADKLSPVEENDVSRQEQFLFLVLLRQSSIIPLSRHAINYHIGIMASFSEIAFALSFIGYIPGILMGVFFGCASATFLKDYEPMITNDVARIILICLGMIGMIIGYAWTVVLSKRHLAMFISKLSSAEMNGDKCNETCEDLHTTCEDLQTSPSQEAEREKYTRDKFLLDMVSIYGYMEETEAVLVEESRDDSASKSQLHFSSMVYG